MSRPVAGASSFLAWRLPCALLSAAVALLLLAHQHWSLTRLEGLLDNAHTLQRQDRTLAVGSHRHSVEQLNEEGATYPGASDRRLAVETRRTLAAAAAAAAKPNATAKAKAKGKRQAPAPALAAAVPPLESYIFDLVLSTGYRPSYGATFASTLVSLLASGAMLHTARLHLLVSDARLLNHSLIYNLAHMRSTIRMSLFDYHHESKGMRARNTFYQLLLAPDADGPSDLPTVFLEDDVWVVDDFAAKLHHVAETAASRTKGQPFFVKLYLHTKIDDQLYGQTDALRALHARKCNRTATVFPPDIRFNMTLPRPADKVSDYHAKPRTYKWGAQGLYFSDGDLRRRVATCFKKYTAKEYDRQKRLKDWPLKTCLNASAIHVFDAGNSLVQHIGASSSLFGDAAHNTRYHRACSFAFMERIITDDQPGDWY